MGRARDVRVDFFLNARRGPVTGDIVPNDERRKEQYVDLYT